MARLFVAVWPPREVVEMLAALPRLDAPVAAEWEVDRVALVDSQLHPAGARYTTVYERLLR